MRQKPEPDHTEAKPNKKPPFPAETTREIVKEHHSQNREKKLRNSEWLPSWVENLSEFSITNLKWDRSDKVYMRTQNRLGIRLYSDCTSTSWMNPRRWNYVWQNGHCSGSSWSTKGVIVKHETQKAAEHPDYVAAKGWICWWGLRYGRSEDSEK